MDAEERALDLIERVRSRPPTFKDEQVTMAHGAGGKASRALVEGLLAPLLGIEDLDDAAVLRRLDGAGQGAEALAWPGLERELVGDLALTTDSFVVKPLCFPGGCIGELAVNGTVNDLAVAGAKPIGLTLALVLEEGLAAAELRAQVEAIAAAAEAAGVEVVAGDTKVVERGRCDGMYVTTTGLGRLDPRARLSPASLEPGDRIIVSGSIGDHGTAVMLARGEFELDGAVESDTRSLWPAVDALLDAAGPSVRAMRDATRGGLATVLNEFARSSGVAILVQEARIPVRPAVHGACEILGIDPMYVANEGKLVAFVAPEAADSALAALRSAPGCEDAAEIGEVRTEPHGLVLVETGFGGRRVLDMLVGDPLPEDLLMHELSIASALVATVEKHAAGRPVVVVNLRVGTLRQVVPDSLAFSFDFVTKGTVCEGARLDVEVVPARVRCGDCGAEWQLDEPLFRCACGSADVEIVAGNELEVESIEIEEDEAACIART